MPGTAVHQRTVAHKREVLAWVRRLATEAGALDPDGLARSLTLLLDGGLASGALDADPEAAAQHAGPRRYWWAPQCDPLAEGRRDGRSGRIQRVGPV